MWKRVFGGELIRRGYAVKQTGLIDCGPAGPRKFGELGFVRQGSPMFSKQACKRAPGLLAENRFRLDQAVPACHSRPSIVLGDLETGAWGGRR